jgi:probable DNA metabolism protein
MIEQGFLTCLPQRELALYELIRRGLAEGDRVRKDLADPTVAKVALALRKQVTEVEHLKGFVRFSELDGVLVGEIEPKNRVLPLMAGHFTARFPGEQLMLYDRTHGEALFCHHFRHAILPVEDFHIGPAGETEKAIRALWRRYYATAAIEERTNPKCQSAHLPKRYRPVMTEFMEEPDPALGEGQTNSIDHILEEESHV